VTKEDVKVAVIGAGVTGLCAGYYLAEALGQDNVVILEAADRVGGTTGTDESDGYSVDWASNGFLSREPATLKWIDDLGLTDELVEADENAAHRFIYKNKRLVEVVGPPKFFFAPLLSPKGRLRLMCEPLIPGKKDDTEESVWAFGARRIGREAADTMVGPMVSGIFGGDAHQLSLAHCFPRMAAMERKHGSLTRALLAKRMGGTSASPLGPSGVLTSFPSGIGYLPKKAQEALTDCMRLGTSVDTIQKSEGGYSIRTADGTAVEAEAVVVATPSPAASSMTEPLDSALSQELAKIPYADIAVVCTGYPRDAVKRDMNGFGFLVPRTQDLRVLGCIWTSSIFPTQAPEGHVLLRTMYGGFTDPEAVPLSDKSLVQYVEREVHPLLGIDGSPAFSRVFKHRKGIPQYLLGHGKHLAVIEDAEDRLPGLVLAGNAYRGIGLNDCVVSAHRAVDRVLAHMKCAATD
jgi:protoporphyrinogen/coproporphyrinogen III oxidase